MKRSVADNANTKSLRVSIKATQLKMATAPCQVGSSLRPIRPLPSSFADDDVARLPVPHLSLAVSAPLRSICLTTPPFRVRLEPFQYRIGPTLGSGSYAVVKVRSRLAPAGRLRLTGAQRPAHAASPDQLTCRSVLAGGDPHRDQEVLCVQSDQQKADEGPRASGQ